MTIKITDKILSIPPHISTTWSRIGALHMKGSVLAITLIDGDTLQIPGLNSDIINLIFHYHTNYLEKEQITSSTIQMPPMKEMMEQHMEEPSIRFAFGSSIENIGTMMQHNPAQADAPDLPAEVLQKITAISKVLGPSEEMILPKAEPGCNCFHCQIARVLNSEIAPLKEEEHEEVTAADLEFQQWSIAQTGDKLFSVTNRLDDKEKYNVFLGQPIGCTCGKEGCEHILAVLKS